MFKKFNYNLNHSYVGGMWGITLAIGLVILFFLLIPEGNYNIMSKTQFIIFMLSFISIINFTVATKILLFGDIQPVNVTYVCPTVRKYMSEQEIAKYEKSVENEIQKDKEFYKELEKAYREI